MTAKPKLNAETLAKLGSQRLADLLMDIAGTDAAVKRRLNLELAAEASPRRLAAAVRKRLAQLGRASSFVDRRGASALAAELDAQRRMIVDRVAKADAVEALDLMWRFTELAETVHDRADDSDGAIGEIFTAACQDLGTLAQAAKPDPNILADQAFDALAAGDYGQYDGLMATLAPSLGNAGLERLKAHFVELSKQQPKRPPDAKREVVGWSTAGPFYRDELEERGRRRRVTLALQEIADIQGDADAFIAQYDTEARKVPGIAAGIALRLLAAGRAEHALQALDATGPPRADSSGWKWQWDWEDARIDVLDALGRAEEAQALRWSCFESALSARHLRAHLERLPDFDDLLAEERALAKAEGHGDLLQALSFLISWPALDQAARAVTRRADEIDGNHYELLTPAADALAAKHPLAATLALRSMIDFTLGKARSSRYRHAARHLLDCSGLATSIADWGRFETHEVYVTRLKADHRRKAAFWIDVE